MVLFFSKFNLSNSFITSADSTDSTSLVYAYANIKILYPGQTYIIRYNITLPEPSKYYKFQIMVDSSVKTGEIEISKFYISNVGDNFPCTPQMTISTNTP